MVEVESFRFGLVFVVEGKKPVAPVDASHLIDATPDIDLGLAGHELVEVETKVQRVAWQVQREFALVEAEAVGVEDPFEGRCRRVNGSRIAQGKVDPGVGDPCAVHLCRLLVEVDAFRVEPQLVELAFDAQVADKTVGVDLRLLERQFVDDHPLLQQGQQSDVGHEFPDVGNGVLEVGDAVVGLNGPEALDAQVERELQTDMLHRDIHACLFRDGGSHLLHRPVLYGWEIE